MGKEKHRIISRGGGKTTVANKVYEIMEWEKSNPVMYFFAMEILIENLLENIKRYKKNAEKSK